jgi:hypothetical protein
MTQSNLSGPLNVTDALIVGGTASFAGAVEFQSGGTVTGSLVATEGITATGGTVTAGSNHLSWGTAAPLAGTRGDVVFNNSATAASGGTVGWICTVAGATATWKAFGTIYA